MIPASVQSTTDATAPLGSYALAAAGFVAAFIFFGWICTGGPQRLLRSWRDARWVVNQAEAYCRQAERQGQR